VKRKPVVLGAAGVGIVLTIALALFQPWKLFIDQKVNEAFPAGAKVVTATPVAKPAVTTATAIPEPTAAEAVSEPAAPNTAQPAAALGPVFGEFRSLEHSTSGTARLVTLEDGRRIIRIENLDSENGPDLVVYLSPQPADGGGFGSGAVNLGKLKGNKGSQNYELPADVDPAKFASVVIWCKRFSVAFGAAPLVVSPA
jgi:hypothetical protein